MTKKISIIQPDHQGTGRRKSSVARVILKQGTGQITINGVQAIDYFPYEILIKDLKQPLTVTETDQKFDVFVNVKGGGFSGQAGAVRFGIARALLTVSEDYRKHLRKYNLLTRDSRVVERKKYGLKGARRAPQFSKR